jgi:hypothetical protein
MIFEVVASMLIAIMVILQLGQARERMMNKAINSRNR